ncbi:MULTISPECIES: DUF2892 domain-containing protein [Sulfurimonas]|uniref:YgaP family membrane protein n=1 Tax=Sulfurimonas TaxID=202746 RepID=UPI001264880D|nr:DUF2892 domain-containing protein [Sulfurimonas indica]
MCINVGKADRIIRTIIGVGLVAYGVMTQSYIVAGIGIIPIATATIGFCPFYPFFKLNTGCKKD